MQICVSQLPRLYRLPVTVFDSLGQWFDLLFLTLKYLRVCSFPEPVTLKHQNETQSRNWKLKNYSIYLGSVRHSAHVKVRGWLAGSGVFLPPSALCLQAHWQCLLSRLMSPRLVFKIELVDRFFNLKNCEIVFASTVCNALSLTLQRSPGSEEWLKLHAGLWLWYRNSSRKQPVQRRPSSIRRSRDKCTAWCSAGDFSIRLE